MNLPARRARRGERERGEERGKDALGLGFGWTLVSVQVGSFRGLVGLMSGRRRCRGR